MNILVPMAGAGSRFVEAGYDLHKPTIPVTNRHASGNWPMVVAAVKDLPVDPSAPENTLIFIIRDFHVTDGVCEIILSHFPNARFVVVDRLTEGQACTCLLARDLIDNNDPLIITACDNGMDLPNGAFERMTATAGAIIFTFRGNESVLLNPKAYGWIHTEGEAATGVSIKQPISDQPINDHAVVGTFWFAKGSDFVSAADACIAANDRINNEFYVDQVFKYLIQDGVDVKVLEVDRYLCWGTPADYEGYERTLTYWSDFLTLEEGR